MVCHVPLSQGTHGLTFRGVTNLLNLHYIQLCSTTTTHLLLLWWILAQMICPVSNLLISMQSQGLNSSIMCPGHV